MGFRKHIQDITDVPTEEVMRSYYLDLWINMWLYTFSVVSHPLYKLLTKRVN
jgi:hypothetical protein